ncbi:MAG TPA: hypothetical protein ENF87_02260 [Thermoproteales archaeon]|nr:hypothetical protein [Thermoproteales archaeon]
MGRRSIAEAIVTKFEKIKEENHFFLVVYDFPGDQGGIPTRFYKNLEYIAQRYQIQRIQKSVIMCKGLKAAKMVAHLAYHYGANVKIFRICDAAAGI